MGWRRPRNLPKRGDLVSVIGISLSHIPKLFLTITMYYSFPYALHIKIFKNLIGVILS